ncbi:MAG: DUF1800 domain-containing protein, partial [Bacteroidota bacterium]|nr:DUF1800 domain-containing protein [Bacteroidota bacterium]
PTRHDTTAKQFSPFYNGTTISGKSGTAGANETDELIDMIFKKDEVSKFICRRLYRWFVYYKIDEATEANVIEPLAKIFRDNNYEIKPVLSNRPKLVLTRIKVRKMDKQFLTHGSQG